MILKNIIQDADPDIIADIWNTWHAEYEKPYDKEKLKSALQHLTQTLTWTEQKPETLHTETLHTFSSR